MKINNTWKDNNEADNFVCLISIIFYPKNNSSSYDSYDSFDAMKNSTTLFTLTVSSEQNEKSLIELSPNIGYTTLLSLKQQKFDLYDIKPNNPNNNILIIELYNCKGNIKYMLSESVTKEGGTKEQESNSYQIDNYKGKKILTTKVNAGVNHYLKVFVDPKEIDNNSNLTDVMYMVKYYSGNAEDMFSYVPFKGGTF